ncbi:hypothetical protein [Acinetobacter sp. YH12145]|uniref:glucosamine inositolphosphorylceramide transferase family protein n=1 Tax=Acinetobacter sp. YH12145 TaxID=2601129 RepID=UPI0015D4026E|nr:hypothetical protein [Acinetobacter sp. YH12145]
MSLFRRVAKKYYNFLEKKRDKSFRSRWYLRFGKLHQPFEPQQIPSLHEIHAPEGHVYADPFIVEENGRTYIFIEEVSPEHPVGYLSVMEVFQDGQYSPPTPIIQCSYHLSYPCVFKHEDTWYMIPESAANKSIELWKCTNFPFSWEFDRILVNDVNAADTTPYYQNGMWYLFTAIKNKYSKKYGNELHIFYSDHLLSSDWKSHPQNPVKKGIVQYRPGGHLTTINDKLVRPSQDSLKRYGGSLDLNEITKLSPEHYEEKFWIKLDSEWHPNDNGCHTFNIFNQHMVIDAIRETPKDL